MGSKLKDIIDIQLDKNEYVYSLDSDVKLEISLNMNGEENHLDRIIINHGYQFFVNMLETDRSEKRIVVFDAESGQGSISSDYSLTVPITIGNCSFVDKISGNSFGGYYYFEVILFHNLFSKPITKKVKINISYSQNQSNIFYYDENLDSDKSTDIKQFLNKWTEEVGDRDDFVWIWRFKYPVLVDKQGGENSIKKFFGDFVSQDNYDKMRKKSFSYKFFENYINSPVRKVISRYALLIILISLLVLVAFYIYHKYHVLSLDVIMILSIIPIMTIITAVISYYLAPKISGFVFNKISGMFYNISLSSKDKICNMINSGNINLKDMFEKFEIHEDKNNKIMIGIFLNVYFSTKGKSLIGNNLFEKKIVSYKLFAGEGDNQINFDNIQRIISDEELKKYLIKPIYLGKSKVYYEIEFKCFCLTMPDFEKSIILE
ncbi:MAG: hypothetical protein V3575_02560 [Candidatus Absconditabacteria bacterium]